MGDRKDQRRLQILTQIVEIYVSTAMPVSSKSVARTLRDRVSSATIRNVMAELEEAGFIEQPHTSAGRRPTDEGYRYFVDLLVNRLKAEKKNAEILDREYSDRVRSMQDVIERTSFLISRELHHPGVVMWPGVNDIYLKHIELIRVKAKTVLAVLITMTNAVRNYIIKVERDLAKAELKSISNFVNSNYEDENVSEIFSDLKRIKDDGPGGNIMKLADISLDIIDKIIETDIQNDIFLEGMEWFAEEPEFMDPSIFQHVLNLFSDKKIFADIMRKELPDRGINIYIGRENRSDFLKDCSIVTSGYEYHGRTIGRIGVVGPRRMNYENVIRTVNYLSDLVSRKLEEFN